MRLSAWAACAVCVASAAWATPTLELLGTGSVPARTDLDKGRVGGLSGLTWRASDGVWLATSDDQRRPRLYTMEIAVDPSARSVRVEITGVIDLPLPPTDAESAACDGAGRVWVGFERPFAVSRFTMPEGDAASTSLGADSALALQVPTLALRHGRTNRGFEAMTLLRREGREEVWAGTETALTVDGGLAGRDGGAACRVFVWDAGTGEFVREHAYITEPTPPGLPLVPGYNSLVEFAALGDGRLLAMERSFTLTGGYDASIRLLEPGSGETDVRGVASLAQGEPGAAGVTPLRATTLATLRGLGVRVNGNFEGLAIGPALPEDAGGGRLVIVVADDNFGEDGQVENLVVALRLRP